ncbi:DNA cytosine methyltransferase [Leisingera sp. ANG-M7]|uniref:DNA cytosine methyltransferase n=1 Tax=Leisingera sp. ANG-M7 TaxID=1577902 RepID=UPI0009DCB07C|nr:DNA cytosine methyltransferase [Leisingera sp. ANG-M7]
MNLPVIDLFAGAGGLSIGATQAGCDVKASVELDATACETLKRNNGFHGNVSNEDVSKISGQNLRTLAGLSSTDPLVVVGGAPCQPFSKAAYWVENGEEARYRRARAQGQTIDKPGTKSEARPDERRNLVLEFWRLINESNADGFVFENVPSIRHPKNRPVLEAFIAEAERAGYFVSETLGKAVEHGVAQKRERVFLLGSKKKKPQAPAPTHALPGKNVPGLLPAFTTGEALDGLDDERYFEPEEIVAGKWADHLKTVPPGWNYKAHTAWAGHPNPTFVTETRFWNFLLKLDPNKPSWTLAASPGPWTGPFHWDSRRLRTVEMAAIQGFPSGYQFSGSRRERVRQLGNAVPPPLAKSMVSSVMEAVA